MERRQRFALAALVFALLFAAKNPSYTIDAAKLGAVKRVAVVTVYAPKSFSEGWSEEIDLQPFVDASEQTVIDGLKQAGYDVVPPAETKAAVAKLYENAYMDAFAAEYKKANPRTSDQEIANGRTMFKHGVLPNKRGSGAVSMGTSRIAGTDQVFFKDLRFTIDGNPVVGQMKRAAHETAAITGLGAVAQAVGADAVVVVRLNPRMADVAEPEMEKAPDGKALGVLPALRNVKAATQAAQSGKYGGNILDLAMYGRGGEVIFADSVIGRSKEETGNAFSGTAGKSVAVPMMKEAVDASLKEAFLHLTGKPLAENTSGLGTTALGIAETAAADARAEAVANAVDPAGTYDLTTVADSPLPYKNQQGLLYERGSLELKSDGTFVATTIMSGRNSTFKGTYTVSGTTITFKSDGNAFTRMFAPKSGVVGADSITVDPNGMIYARKR